MRPERQNLGPINVSALLSEKPKEGFLMAKIRKGRLAGPDDPIFKEGVTFYTRKSDRISTTSTKPSPEPRPKAPPKEDTNE